MRLSDKERPFHVTANNECECEGRGCVAVVAGWVVGFHEGMYYWDMCHGS